MHRKSILKAYIKLIRYGEKMGKIDELAQFCMA